MTSASELRPCPRCGVVRLVNNTRARGKCRDCNRISERDGRFMHNAACRGTYDPEWWWPVSGDAADAQQALAVCATCPVVEPCLNYALENREDQGIWGGTTPIQRQHIRAQRRHRIA